MEYARRSHGVARAAKRGEVVSLAEARRRHARAVMAYDVIGQEAARRERYKTLRLPPCPLPQGPNTRDAKWLHMLLDGISGPPYLSKVYLAQQEKIGLVRAVFWPEGVRCEVRLPSSVVKNRDRDAVARELAYGLDSKKEHDFVRRVAGLSEWLERNMHR